MLFLPARSSLVNTSGDRDHGYLVLVCGLAFEVEKVSACLGIAFTRGASVVDEDATAVAVAAHAWACDGCGAGVVCATAEVVAAVVAGGASGRSKWGGGGNDGCLGCRRVGGVGASGGVVVSCG